MKPIKRYWDSSVFLAWLLPEEKRVPACRDVLEAAEEGRIKIYTSAVTLTEVIKLKGQPPLKADQEKMIADFFKRSCFVVHSATRFVAERARALIWEFPNVHPKDSIHLATALEAGIVLVDTFDEAHMIPLDGKIGDPPMKIGFPKMDQPKLPFAEAQGASHGGDQPQPAAEMFEDENEEADEGLTN